MSYSTYPVVRTKYLNEKYFEVLFKRKTLNFTPGSYVTLYNDPTPMFIASGISEPWIRLILKTDQFYNLLDIKKLKLNMEIDNPFSTLINETQPSFIVTSEMLSVFFSYASTFPNVKCKICYLGPDKISEDWIKHYHIPIDKISKMKRAVSSLYIMGNKEILNLEAKNLLTICKANYLI